MWSEHLKGREIGFRQGRGDYDPAKPDLLMLHGAGGSTMNYLLQLSGLGGVCNPAALDLPGHGQTPGPASDSVEVYTDWLAEFLDAGPVRPVLLGHSMGGAIAQTLALKRPDLISGLILVGTGCRLRVAPAILEGVATNFGPAVEMIVVFAHGDQPDPNLVRQGVELMSAAGPEVLGGDFTACDRFDLCDAVEGIHTPTLVVVGDQDKMTPLKYSRTLVDKIPGARLAVIPGAGHLAHVERPQEFNLAVAGFLSPA